MSHVALYRKYRSQTFGDLVGQEHVVRTLQNAIRSGQFHHAYLFTGPRGTGKTSTARLLAKALNCEEGLIGEPCNACGMCRSITEGTCIDVIEMDAASDAGVDDVRERIVDVIEYRPALGRYKIFIVDEVHDLSPKAFDALLKTIEEPPGHIMFILATTELHKVPPTIQSRCQKFQFNRGSLADLVARLEYVLNEEKIPFEPAAVQTLARMADGGFRDALSLLEQAAVTRDGALTVDHVLNQLGLIRDDVVDRLLIAVHQGESEAILNEVDEIYRTGRDAKAIAEAMLVRLAELSRASLGLETSTESTQEAALRATAQRLGLRDLIRLREGVAGILRDVRDVSLPKFWLESVLLGMGQDRATVAAVAMPALAPAPAAPDAPSKKPAAPPRQGSAARVVAETGDPLLDEARRAWSLIVDEMSRISKVAAAKLSSTEVTAANEDKVTVAFTRQMDVDSVTKSAKLHTAILSEWSKRRGSREWDLEMVAAGGPPVPTAMDATVELPAEGAKLNEIARDVFKNF